jgi:vacuolar-type H+-ATPase subunit C/Vma6
MTPSFFDNLIYLATKLHARRSGMREGERLEALGHIRLLPELARALGMDTDCRTAADFQRRLAKDLIYELASFAKHVGETGSKVFSCLLVRFQMENVKVVLRGLINKIPQDELRLNLLPLPQGLALEEQNLMGAGSLEDFAALLPHRPPYRRVREAIFTERQRPIPFFFEMALDNDYFQELLSKARRLLEEDVAAVRPLIVQEANLFQFMLVIRGKFVYRLPAESLRSLGLEGVADAWFKEVLAAPDMLTAAKCGVGTVLDEIPANPRSGGNILDPAVLETLAWKRYARLANAAFRRGHMGLGAVIGYAGLRRIEVANLITLSEGIRMGITDGALRQRFIPTTNLEAIHV